MISSNNKVSLVAPSQLPAFVQDDYQTFIAFLEAYYEFLEQDGGVNWGLDKLNSAFDVDAAIDQFLDRFKDQYLNGWPDDMLADKALVIKNIKQFYLSKGTEKSIKFLFRALFGEDITIFYPNRSILKVSDGKWVKEQALRITGNILNIYTGDGNTASYIISDTVNSKANLHVFINETEITQNNFTLSGRTVTLSQNVANNDTLTIDIEGADYNRFVGQQIFGSLSEATAIVEKYKQVFDKGQFYNELTVTDLAKAFVIGENAYTFFIDDENNISIKIAVPITSSVIDVEIVSGGTFYNVGDPLVFTSNVGSGAEAFVASIFRSGIRSLEVLAKGAGFEPGVFFNITGGGGTGAVIQLNGVDSSGFTHPNTYNVTTDIIHTYANTPINSNTYGFPAFANANLNTLLSQSFQYQQYGLCGPVDPTQVLIITEGQDYSAPPTIKLPVPIFEVNVAGNTANVAMTDFGILGSLKIINGGSGYAVGDEVIFTNQPGSSGQDAAAAVTSVSATGGIAKIDFQPPRISGTANISAGSNVVLGIGTAFSNAITANAKIMINNESQIVKTVVNANSIIIFGTWANSANNKKIGVYGRNFIGGSGYHMGELPTISLSSVGGVDANVVCDAVIGDGDDVRVSSLQPVGKIRTIKVSQGGRGYLEPPLVDLTMSGDGTANVIAEIAGGMFQYPGRYKNEDGLLSGTNKIHDRDFYQLYSYVIQSKNTLDKYEKILKQLAHPLGMKQFAEVEVGFAEVSPTDSTNVFSYGAVTENKFLKLSISGKANTHKTP